MNSNPRSRRSFLIWFQQRSGSTQLVSMLNSHREIHCKGEMFGCFPVAAAEQANDHPDCRVLGDQLYRRVINQFPGRVESPTDSRCTQELREFMFSTNGNDDRRLRGFKFKFPSQSELFPEIANALVEAASEINLVVIHRRDYLRRALSVLNLPRLQAETERANLNSEINLPPADFDSDEIVRLMKYYQEIENEFGDWASRFPNRFDLNYADLQDEEQARLTELQEFLGVQPKPKLQSATHKITPRDLRQLITNYAEVAAAVQHAGLEIDDTL